MSRSDKQAFLCLCKVINYAVQFTIWLFSTLKGFSDNPSPLRWGLHMTWDWLTVAFGQEDKGQPDFTGHCQPWTGWVVRGGGQPRQGGRHIKRGLLCLCSSIVFVLFSYFCEPNSLPLSCSLCWKDVLEKSCFYGRLSKFWLKGRIWIKLMVLAHLRPDF